MQKCHLNGEQRRHLLRDIQKYMFRATRPEAKRMLFLPAKVNQEPARRPMFLLQLYCKAGAMLNCSLEGLVMEAVVLPEKRFLLVWE